MLRDLDELHATDVAIDSLGEKVQLIDRLPVNPAALCFVALGGLNWDFTQC
jgi:hypothetical protein